MPSATTIKVIIAAVVVAGLVVIVGATVDPGTTAAPPVPITRQIMRRKDGSKLPASANEIAELRRKAQDKEKRDLKIREFKDIPLKIHAIRNVDSETWYKDLQIEVKNTGTKPIYFVLAYLEFPDHKPGGRDTGLALTYGDLKYWDIGVLADPKDLHIDPGQTYVFTIPERARVGVGKQHERVPQEFKKLDFHIDIISFGDRTGFEIGHPWICEIQSNLMELFTKSIMPKEESHIRPFVLRHRMVVAPAVAVLLNPPSPVLTSPLTNGALLPLS